MYRDVPAFALLDAPFVRPPRTLLADAGSKAALQLPNSPASRTPEAPRRAEPGSGTGRGVRGDDWRDGAAVYGVRACRLGRELGSLHPYTTCVWAGCAQPATRPRRAGVDCRVRSGRGVAAGASRACVRVSASRLCKKGISALEIQKKDRPLSNIIIYVFSIESIARKYSGGAPAGAIGADRNAQRTRSSNRLHPPERGALKDT